LLSLNSAAGRATFSLSPQFPASFCAASSGGSPPMHRRALLALVASVSALAATRSAFARQLTDTEVQLLKDIGDHNSAIRTMVGRFLQIDTRGQRIEGTFYLERPNKVRFRYNPPSREEIISIGKGFYVIDRKEQTQYAYPQDRVPLREFLTDRIDLLHANIVDFVATDDYATVTLSDDTPIGKVQVQLIFDIESKDLKQWTLAEPSGEELTFSVYDVQTDVDIPKSYFYIDPTYKAVEPPRD
jgi:outer membrane lipoprotein-sorting protein